MEQRFFKALDVYKTCIYGWPGFQKLWITLVLYFAGIVESIKYLSFVFWFILLGLGNRTKGN